MEKPILEKNSKRWMPPFFTIWSGQAVSLLGSQLVQFALVWWLTQKTGSATVLATASLVALLPQVLLGPLTGALVDRWNRRLVLIAADTCVALATFGLALLFWLGNVQIWHVYLMLFVRAVGGGFHWPAMQASTSLMVPKEHLARIQGLNQVLSGAMNIGAAPLGAVLLGVLPMQGILAIDVITASIAIFPLFFIPIPQPERRAAPEALQEKASLWHDLLAGFRYVWAWGGLMLIVLMATLINFMLAPAGALQPLLVTKHFNGQALQLAWMETAWGIGMVAGGLTLSAWGGFRRRILTSLGGLLVLGAGMAGIGLVPASGYWVAVGLLFFVGFSLPIVNGPLLAVVQAVVAPDMQGRVFTLISSAASAMMPLSLLAAGPIADSIGVRSWYVLAGLATALLGLAAFFVPAIIRIEENHAQAQTIPEIGEQLPALAAQPAELGGD